MALFEQSAAQSNRLLRSYLQVKTATSRYGTRLPQDQWQTSRAIIRTQLANLTQIYCAKTLLDCATVYAVGTDKFIQQFDIRVGSVVNKHAVNEYASMNYICSPQTGATENYYDVLHKTLTVQRSKLVRTGELFELMVAHQDGSITNW